MKVIFQQDVRGQGKKGEMKEVSEGYGRNYLLPRGLAVEANKDNLNTLALREKAKKAQEARERAEAEEAAAKLRDVIVTVRAKAGANGRLFGSVTSQEIVDALREGEHRGRGLRGLGLFDERGGGDERSERLGFDDRLGLDDGGLFNGLFDRQRLGAAREFSDAALGGFELLLEILVLHIQGVDGRDDLIEELIDLDLVVSLAELDVLELLVQDVFGGEQGHFLASR